MNKGKEKELILGGINSVDIVTQKWCNIYFLPYVKKKEVKNEICD